MRATLSRPPPVTSFAKQSYPRRVRVGIRCVRTLPVAFAAACVLVASLFVFRNAQHLAAGPAGGRAHSPTRAAGGVGGTPRGYPTVASGEGVALDSDVGSGLHVIEFRAGGAGWQPVPGDGGHMSAVGDLDAIADAFFGEDRVRFTPSVPRTDMVGFIRVTKTASSGLLNFAGSTDAVRTSDVILNQEFKNQEFIDEHGSSRYACLLGENGGSGEAATAEKLRHCTHATYKGTVNFWAHSVAAVRNPTERQYTLQTFTLLREPFDRLVSYFNYAREIYPWWNESSTEAQNRMIVAGDFGGWLRKLKKEDGSYATGIPYQKNFIHFDADRAISIITGDRPRVLALLTECFEASVLILTERFPRLFSRDAAVEYFERPRSNVYHNKTQFEAFDMVALRKKAMRWFKPDYRVYAAAVGRFRGHLSASGVDPRTAAECLLRLESATRQGDG